MRRVRGATRGASAATVGRPAAPALPRGPRPVGAPLLRAVAVAGAVVALAACTTPTGGTPAPAPGTAPVAGPATPGSTPSADAWVDQVCAAGITVATPAVTVPDVRVTDPASTRTALVSYLDAVLAGIRQGRAQLDAAGPAPVAGGDVAVARARAVLDGLEATVTDARTQLARADPADPVAFAAALSRMRATLTSTTAPDALRELLATPGVADAAGRSPQCAQLKILVAAAPH